MMDLSVLPEEMQGQVGAAISMMDPAVILKLMTDATTARQLLDDGDVDAARALVEPYRAQAEAAGLGPVFDSLMGDIFGSA